AAAEDHTLAVWRHAIVAEHALGIGQRAALGDERACDIARERLGGENVAGERDQPLFELRGGVAGVAVGGDDDVTGLDVAARGRDAPALARWRDGLHRRLRTDSDRPPARRIEQALVVERRM